MKFTDPHSHTNITQGKVAKVELDLTADFERSKLKGNVRLKFDHLTKDYIDLDTRDLIIKEVTDSNNHILTWDLGDRNSVLGSRLRIMLPLKTEYINVLYETTPQSTALQWLDPSNTSGRKYPFLFSQCQPHHARSVLPIQDSPIVRFPYKALIRVPKPLVVVMSASPGEKLADADGLYTYHFEMPQPIPAYLMAIAIGDIAKKDIGPRTRIYAESELLEKAAFEFEPINSILIKAEELFGKYLWDRYDVLVMPPAFPYGGMENPRLNFVTPTMIAGDRSLVNLIAHELAHSWTGNLVTNASMEDFWLNEGFAVWAERRITEVLEGTEAAIFDAVIGSNGFQKDILRFGKDSPFTKLKTDLTGIDPDAIYSQIPYEKGFLFLTLLEQRIGRNEFDLFIREYIKRFKFKSITTEQFLEYFDESNPGILEDVKANEWVYEPGIPSNSPSFHSDKLDKILSLCSEINKGEIPDFEITSNWRPREWIVYLSNLPDNLPYEVCKNLDNRFQLTQSENAEILFQWLLKVASSGYDPSFQKIHDFLGTVGRMKFLNPLYKALTERNESKDFAYGTFNEFEDRYHPIARSALNRIFQNLEKESDLSDNKGLHGKIDKENLGIA